jgi:hypothetical protein
MVRVEFLIQTHLMDGKNPSNQARQHWRRRPKDVDDAHV